MTGTAVRAGHPTPHRCVPPCLAGHPYGPAAGHPGDVWRCGCGQLWVLRDIGVRGTTPHEWSCSPVWRRAGWWLSWHHRKTGTA